MKRKSFPQIKDALPRNSFLATAEGLELKSIMICTLNPRSWYKRDEQFVWKENPRCGSTIQDYRECAGALKHHLHGREINSAWHRALVAVSHWLVQVGSQSSHLLVHTWETFDCFVRPGSIFKAN
jgi:hypothetical protein